MARKAEAIQEKMAKKMNERRKNKNTEHVATPASTVGIEKYIIAKFKVAKRKGSYAEQKKKVKGIERYMLIQNLIKFPRKN